MRTESRERGPALLTCTDEEGGTSCRRKNWGDDLFRREKPLDVRARSRPFLLTRAPGRGQCMGLHAGKIPCTHSSAKQHRCRRSLAEKQLSFTRRSLESHVRAGSRPVLPARAQTGLQLLVQFPVTTVHTCRNVQQVCVHSYTVYSTCVEGLCWMAGTLVWLHSSLNIPYSAGPSWLLPSPTPPPHQFYPARWLLG